MWRECVQVGAEEGKPHKEEDFKYKYTKNTNTEKIVHKKYMHAFPNPNVSDFYLRVVFI